MSNHLCYSCRFYKPYYVKGNTRFNKLDTGYCTQSKTTVEKHCECEKFQNMYFARYNFKKAVFSALAENLNTIAEIKQILEEDTEEAWEAFVLEHNLKKQRERDRLRAEQEDIT